LWKKEGWRLPFHANCLPSDLGHPTLMRLFLGLPIPSELAHALTRLTQTIELHKARRTTPENIHLTLVFLGEVAELALPHIERELFELTFAPLQLKLTGLNTFPRAGVLFVEVEPTRALLHLQTNVAAAMARCGFTQKNLQPPEARPYHPHITLARFRGQLHLNQNQRILQPAFQRSFSADTINLYRSNTTAAGPHYQILAQKKGHQTAQTNSPRLTP
jgi:2'-5' RNA ligase